MKDVAEVSPWERAWRCLFVAPRLGRPAAGHGHARGHVHAPAAGKMPALPRARRWAEVRAALAWVLASWLRPADADSHWQQ